MNRPVVLTFVFLNGFKQRENITTLPMSGLVSPLGNDWFAFAVHGNIYYTSKS
jgi:hypothetical protein